MTPAELTLKELNAKFKLRSDKRALFCVEYVKDLNGTQAAIRAKYSKKTAQVIASENLVKPMVMECIAYLQSIINEKDDSYNAEDLRKDLVAMKNMSIGDIYNDDWKLKKISEWPEVWLKNVSAIDVSSLVSSQGNEEDSIEIIKKIKWPDKTRIMDMLGKHIDIQAWREIHKIEEDSIVERMNRAKEREENASPTKH